MSVHDVVLAGPDVRLEPVQQSDAAALWALTDDDLWAGMTSPRPMSVESYAQHIASQQAASGVLAFTIRGTSSGEVRGSTSLYDLVPSQKRVEIGFTWYGRAYWGGRTNPAAKLLLLEHAFDVLALNRVALRCDSRNTRSVQAIQRLGAIPEGVLRAHRVAADGSQGDTAYFSITRLEWPRVCRDLHERLTS